MACAIPSYTAPKDSSRQTPETGPIATSKFSFFASAATSLALLLPVLSAAATEFGDGGRPSIGLVLSGGGARGGAHVGVIRVLDEMRIPVDFIAGTSMGAIVGGLYASGIDADELVERLVQSDWPGLLSDRPPRAERSFRRKSDDEGFLVNFDVGVRFRQLQFPQGIVQGQKLTLALKRLVIPSLGKESFDDLPIPFRAVATDIVNGDAVILDHGDLADSLRASMSVPGIFKPVRIDGRLLVDGGIADNLPVDIARAMGADLLIVVDVGFPLLPEEDLSSPIALTSQALTIMINARSRDQRASLGPGDLLISPDLGDLGSEHFERMVEAMQVGETTARSVTRQLQALSLSRADYAAHRALVATRRSAPPRIDGTTVEIETRLAPTVIEARLHDQTGQIFDVAQLEQDIAEIYGLDTFETIDYSLDRAGEQTILRVRGQRKSWGPNFLRFGINLEDDFEGTSNYNFATRYTRTEVNPLGGELRADLQIGENPGVAVELYQPLDSASRWFVNPSISAIRESDNLFRGSDQLATLRSDILELSLAAGRNFGNWGELRLTVARSESDAKLIVGDPVLSGGSLSLGSIEMAFSHDTIDRLAIPRSGTFFGGTFLSIRDELGADVSGDVGALFLLKPQTWGKHTLLHWWEIGSLIGSDSNAIEPFGLGGLFSLSGFARGELSGAHISMGRLLYYRRMTDNVLSLLDTPIYLGASLETGNVWQDRADFGVRNMLVAGSIFAIFDTVIGPLYIAYGAAEGGRRSAYLFLGQTF